MPWAWNGTNLLPEPKLVGVLSTGQNGHPSPGGFQSENLPQAGSAACALDRLLSPESAVLPCLGLSFGDSHFSALPQRL